MSDTNAEKLDQLYREVLKGLDISKEILDEAKNKYRELARWLQEDAKSRYNSDSLLYIQGSTLLGTSIKPINNSDDFDFDLVYRRDIQRGSITQAELKNQLGEQLRSYIAYLEKIGVRDIPPSHRRRQMLDLEME